MNQYLSNIVNFFKPLNAAQKVLFGLFTTAIILLIGLVFYWALTPSYSILFGSLTPANAQEIVEELETMGVKYNLGNNGRTINVPRDRVHELRLKFASTGGGGNEYKGYELFDQNTLGMTDFMQKLNQKRALEGELARTINHIEQVESSRIHIVIPDRSPFQEASVEPSASVIITLGTGRHLQSEHIDGIGSLIAGSVEGLSKENVIILDQAGNRISDNTSPNNELAANSAHIKLKQTVEAYLTEKGQTMLDRVLGPGNGILRISTDHNFDRVVRESNLIDPESRIIISEERRTSRNIGQSQEPIPGEDQPEPFTSVLNEDETSSQVRNYEVNRILEQHESQVGEITRISASLLLDHKRIPNKETDEIEIVPYTDEELEDIKNVMISAVGILPSRGDQISVTQIRFQDSAFMEETGSGWLPQYIPYGEIFKYIFLSIVMIVISSMVYRMSKNFGVGYEPLIDGDRSNRNLQKGKDGKYLSDHKSEETEEDIYEKKLSEEARKKLKTKQSRTEKIGTFIDKNPREAAQLVRTMINENA